MKGAPTLAALRRRAAAFSVAVCDDRDCDCYRAEAPEGFTLDGDLHEYVAVYPTPADKADARRDLFERLADLEPEPCEGPCDWCGSS